MELSAKGSPKNYNTMENNPSNQSLELVQDSNQNMSPVRKKSKPSGEDEPIKLKVKYGNFWTRVPK